MTHETRFRQQLIWAFYVPSALIAVAYSILTPILPLYAGNLTSAYVLIGIVLAAEAIGTVTGDLPASWVIRYIGMKRTMLLGITIAFVPMLALFFVDQIALATVLLFVSGIGHALYNISRHAYITIVAHAGIRGRTIGLLGGVFRIGKFIGPLLGGWVGGTFGLRYAFIAFGILAALTLVFVYVFLRANRVNTAAKPEHTQRHLIGEVLKQRGHVLATAGTGQILAQLTRVGWRVLIPLYASNMLGLDVQTIGLIVGAGAAFDMLFFYVSGILMDRFGRKWAIVPSFVMQGIGVALILVVSDAWSLGGVAMFIGFANGLSSGTMMTLGSDFAPPTMRGEFLSMWRLIGDMGMVGGPIVVGTVAQVLVLQGSVLSIAGAGLGAAALFAFFVPETLQKRKKSVTSGD